MRTRVRGGSEMRSFVWRVNSATKASTRGLITELSRFARQYGERAIAAFGKPLCFDAKCVVKASAIVFPCNSGRKFDHLSGAELLLEFRKQRVRKLDRRLRHGVGIFEYQFFCFGEQCAALVVGQGFEFFVREAAGSADRRTDIDSKRTSDERGNS
jgi:hypothetical protein